MTSEKVIIGAQELRVDREKTKFVVGRIDSMTACELVRKGLDIVFDKGVTHTILGWDMIDAIQNNNRILGVKMGRTLDITVAYTNLSVKITLDKTSYKSSTDGFGKYTEEEIEATEYVALNDVLSQVQLGRDKAVDKDIYTIKEIQDGQKVVARKLSINHSGLPNYVKVIRPDSIEAIGDIVRECNEKGIFIRDIKRIGGERGSTITTEYRDLKERLTRCGKLIQGD